VGKEKNPLRQKRLVLKGFLKATNAVLTKNTPIIYHLFIKINWRIIVEMSGLL
jgi:hypothetical protein